MGMRRAYTEPAIVCIQGVPDLYDKPATSLNAQKNAQNTYEIFHHLFLFFQTFFFFSLPRVSTPSARLTMNKTTFSFIFFTSQKTQLKIRHFLHFATVPFD